MALEQRIPKATKDRTLAAAMAGTRATTDMIKAWDQEEEAAADAVDLAEAGDAVADGSVLQYTSRTICVFFAWDIKTELYHSKQIGVRRAGLGEGNSKYHFIQRVRW